MKILLIGAPASGKGTIGKLLSERLDLPLVSVGALLRELPYDTPEQIRIHEVIDKGNLAPNDLVAKILEKRLNQADVSNGFVLDGWGRRLSDIQIYDPGFDLVLFLKISEETVIKRISGRRVCPKDGTNFNVYTNPSKFDGICDICGSVLETRADDTEEIAKERIEIFNLDTLPTINFFKEKGILIEVNGEPLPSEIFSNLSKILNI